MPKDIFDDKDFFHRWLQVEENRKLLLDYYLNYFNPPETPDLKVK